MSEQSYILVDTVYYPTLHYSQRKKPTTDLTPSHIQTLFDASAAEDYNKHWKGEISHN